MEAIRRGAYDYLSKPFKEEELLLRVAKALETRRLRGEVSLLAGEFRRRYGLEHIIGRSAAMREVLERVVRVAPTDATVLITGESRHRQGARGARAPRREPRAASEPFVPVNCAAITETLLETELFGHAKGAFTGASRARRGLFEEADGGTLFIDEIGETTPGFQAKLLRALQEGEIRRVGESTPIQVDVRVDRRDQPGPPARHRREALPRGPLLPAQRGPPARCRRCASAARTSRCSPPTSSGASTRGPARRARSRRDAVARLAAARLAGQRARARERGRAGGGARARGRRSAAADVTFEAHAAAPAPAAGGTLAAAVEEAERRTIEAALLRCGGDLVRGGAGARRLAHHALAQDEAARPRPGPLISLLQRPLQDCNASPGRGLAEPRARCRNWPRFH